MLIRFACLAALCSYGCVKEVEVPTSIDIRTGAICTDAAASSSDFVGCVETDRAALMAFNASST